MQFNKENIAVKTISKLRRNWYQSDEIKSPHKKDYRWGRKLIIYKDVLRWLRAMSKSWIYLQVLIASVGQAWAREFQFSAGARADGMSRLVSRLWLAAREHSSGSQSGSQLRLAARSSQLEFGNFSFRLLLGLAGLLGSPINFTKSTAHTWAGFYFVSFGNGIHRNFQTLPAFLSVTVSVRRRPHKSCNKFRWLCCKMKYIANAFASYLHP